MTFRGHRGFRLGVMSNRFATVAPMSAFPESERQPPPATPLLLAIGDSNYIAGKIT
jgi:hypothetical protein